MTEGGEPPIICGSESAATSALASGTELRLLKNFFGFATVTGGLSLFDGVCTVAFTL